jgi:hypothetical protein
LFDTSLRKIAIEATFFAVLMTIVLVVNLKGIYKKRLSTIKVGIYDYAFPFSLAEILNDTYKTAYFHDNVPSFYGRGLTFIVV